MTNLMVLFNKLLMNKATTGQYKGGNTDISYSGDGRLVRSRGLQDFWPGDFKIIRKNESWRIAPSRVWDKFPQLPKGSNIDFNGNTGPFIQYTYARIQSLLSKGYGNLKNDLYTDFNLKEREISKIPNLKICLLYTSPSPRD